MIVTYIMFPGFQLFYLFGGCCNGWMMPLRSNRSSDQQVSDSHWTRSSFALGRGIAVCVVYPGILTIFPLYSPRKGVFPCHIPTVFPDFVEFLYFIQSLHLLLVIPPIPSPLNPP